VLVFPKLNTLPAEADLTTDGAPNEGPDEDADAAPKEPVALFPNPVVVADDPKAGGGCFCPPNGLELGVEVLLSLEPNENVGGSLVLPNTKGELLWVLTATSGLEDVTKVNEGAGAASDEGAVEFVAPNVKRAGLEFVPEANEVEGAEVADLAPPNVNNPVEAVLADVVVIDAPNAALEGLELSVVVEAPVFAPNENPPVAVLDVEVSSLVVPMLNDFVVLESETAPNVGMEEAAEVVLSPNEKDFVGPVDKVLDVSTAEEKLKFGTDEDVVTLILLSVSFLLPKEKSFVAVEVGGLFDFDELFAEVKEIEEGFTPTSVVVDGLLKLKFADDVGAVTSGLDVSVLELFCNGLLDASKLNVTVACLGLEFKASLSVDTVLLDVVEMFPRENGVDVVNVESVDVMLVEALLVTDVLFAEEARFVPL